MGVFEGTNCKFVFYYHFLFCFFCYTLSNNHLNDLSLSLFKVANKGQTKINEDSRCS